MKHDLHSHTNFSACADKNNNWQKLLKKFEENKLDVVSITDHNTCIFHVINKFQNTKDIFSGKIIPGMECDVAENGIGFEILAYDFDVMQTFNWAFETYGTLETRQERIKNALIKLAKEKGIELDISTPLQKNQYAHNYVFSCMKNSKRNQEFFEKYNLQNSDQFYRASSTNKDFPLYLDMNSFCPTPKEVINAIHNLGGKVVLAHPFNYPSVNAQTLIDIALKENIDGIEVFHPSANAEQVEFLLKIAKKYNLLITGGSDFHGTEKHNDVGILNKNTNENLIYFN